MFPLQWTLWFGDVDVLNIVGYLFRPAVLPLPSITSTSMLRSMQDDDSPVTRVSSVNAGQEILQEKGLLDELRDLCAAWSSYDGPPNNVLRQFDWETEYSFPIGRNRPRFDGFKDRVGLEHETREQMNIRSHILWMEAGFQTDVIDTGVFVIPRGSYGSVRRTENELHDDIFTEHFPIDCPLVLLEYEPSSMDTVP